MDLADIAADLGLYVFPLDGNKTPVIRGGFKAAATERAKIREMFRASATKLIGVPTGKINGFVAIDVDVKGDAQGMAWLKLNENALPQTRTHKTRSGGLHLIFQCPADVEIRNSASRIAPGVDVRGEGGYLVFPPSEGYAIADKTPPAIMPDWLIRACLPPERTQQPTHQRHDPILEGGTKYGLAALSDECSAIMNAPFGKQEDTLNSAALKIGALVAGGQIAEHVARHQLERAGNQMASESGQMPWTPRDISEKVRRGMDDGARSPRAPREAYNQTYEHKAAEALAQPATAPLWIIDKPWSETDIPHRPWIVKGFLLRSAVTVLSGPGSAGKSSLTIAWCVSLASGLQFGRFKPTQAHRVLSYNTEDDRHEQMRRISATCRQFDITPSAIMQNLRMVGPNEVGTLLTLGPDGRMLLNTPVMDALKEQIEQFKPDVVILDPFVELHSSEENDNTAIRLVIAKFRSWAVQENISLTLLHHSRKGFSSPGDPDSLRGASAIVGAARVALTVNTMTEAEAEQMSIPTDHRRDYFRVDGAKMNYSKVQDADWYERAEYVLDNDEEVAAAVPWQIPHQAINLTHITQIITAIERGTALGPYSPKLSADPRSIKAAMVNIDVTLPRAQKELLDKVLADPNVATSTFKSATDRVKRQGLKTANGPTATWCE